MMWRTSKPLLDELLRQLVEQLGIGRRIARADVVERLDDADADEVAPDAVDVALGEILVVRDWSSTRPVARGASRPASSSNFAAKGNFGSRDLAGAQVRHFARALVVDDFEQRLGALDRGAADGLAAAGRDRPARSTCAKKAAVW